MDERELGDGSEGASITPSPRTSSTKVAETFAENQSTPPSEFALSHDVPAGSTHAHHAAAPDGATSVNAAASPPLEGLLPEVDPQAPPTERNDNVEYRWPYDGQWYQCNVLSTTGAKGDKKRVIELEYLPTKKARVRHFKHYTEKLDLDELVDDGDLASPGKHLRWD